MSTEQNPKQLVTQRLKEATNILVTVGRDPGVDELSAALALTLILDKIGKTPTAVFSGTIPPAIEFLEPDKTFDTSVDSLRDFIIALDKEKADRLRYKVDGDVVRVFITPYKTTITEDDLTFTQGDFNVDLIVAFGVEKREDLDVAITAHGRILHDATVVTINQLPGHSSLGEIDWTDTEASSLCEMLMSISESLQTGVLNEPIATAILTGLVASTDRFSNEKTSPKVMTMAAQLMAAGANQQLIAEKLEEAEIANSDDSEIKVDQSENDSESSKSPTDDSEGEIKVDHDESSEDSDADSVNVKDDSDADSVNVKDDSDADSVNVKDDSDAGDMVDNKTREIASEESAEAVEAAHAELEKIADTQSTADESTEKPERVDASAGSWRDAPMPSTGGTLNATTEGAEIENRKREEDTRNRIILSHSEPALGEPDSNAPALNYISSPSEEPAKVRDILSEPAIGATNEPLRKAGTVLNAVGSPVVPVATEPANSEIAGSATPQEAQLPVVPIETALPVGVEAQQNQVLTDLESQTSQQYDNSSEALPAVQISADGTIDTARAAVDAVFETQPFSPAGQPLYATGAQTLGNIEHAVVDFGSAQAQQSTESPVVEQQVTGINPQAEPVPVPTAPSFDTAGLPPLPDFSTLPPLPGASTETPPVITPNFGLPEQPQVNDIFPVSNAPIADPGQFVLPGQN